MRAWTDPKIQRLTFPGAGENEVDVYPEDPPEERFFRDLSIIKKGKEVLTPFLNEREEGGWIAYLELIIYSNYAKKGTTYRSQKYSVREYQWTSN